MYEYVKSSVSDVMLGEWPCSSERNLGTMPHNRKTFTSLSFDGQTTSAKP
jgi:hypothetical protein